MSIRPWFRPLALAVTVAPLLALIAQPVRAEDRIAKRLWLATGPAGKTVQVDSFRELREDCSQAPAPKVTVLQHPAFGKFKVAAVTAPGQTDKTGPYAACDGKKFAWTRVTTPLPAKGEGTDRAVIQAQESSGEITTYDIEIVFAKKLPAGKSSGLYEDR